MTGDSAGVRGDGGGHADHDDDARREVSHVRQGGRKDRRGDDDSHSSEEEAGDDIDPSVYPSIDPSTRAAGYRTRQPEGSAAGAGARVGADSSSSLAGPANADATADLGCDDDGGSDQYDDDVDHDIDHDCDSGHDHADVDVDGDIDHRGKVEGNLTRNRDAARHMLRRPASPVDSAASPSGSRPSRVNTPSPPRHSPVTEIPSDDVDGRGSRAAESFHAVDDGATEVGPAPEAGGFTSVRAGVRSALAAVLAPDVTHRGPGVTQGPPRRHMPRLPIGAASTASAGRATAGHGGRQSHHGDVGSADPSGQSRPSSRREAGLLALKELRQGRAGRADDCALTGVKPSANPSYHTAAVSSADVGKMALPSARRRGRVSGVVRVSMPACDHRVGLHQPQHQSRAHQQQHQHQVRKRGGSRPAPPEDHHHHRQSRIPRRAGRQSSPGKEHPQEPARELALPATMAPNPSDHAASEGFEGRRDDNRSQSSARNRREAVSYGRAGRETDGRDVGVTSSGHRVRSDGGSAPASAELGAASRTDTILPHSAAGSGDVDDDRASSGYCVDADADEGRRGAEPLDGRERRDRGRCHKPAEAFEVPAHSPGRQPRQRPPRRLLERLQRRQDSSPRSAGDGSAESGSAEVDPAIGRAGRLPLPEGSAPPAQEWRDSPAPAGRARSRPRRSVGPSSADRHAPAAAGPAVTDPSDPSYHPSVPTPSLARLIPNGRRVELALRHVCLAAPTVRDQLKEAVDVIRAGTGDAFVVLLRSRSGTAYKGLYRLQRGAVAELGAESLGLVRVAGGGPGSLRPDDCRAVMRFDTAGKRFAALPLKAIESADAVAMR